MPSEKKHLKIFISHCSDTNEHVKAIRDIINQINATLADYHLDVYDKSDISPSAGNSKDIIFKQCPVDTWDIYIGLLWYKYENRIELEFDKAYSHWEETDHFKPEILFYRCDIPVPPSQINNEQNQKINSFFSERSQQIYYQSYNNIEQLKQQIDRHIRKRIETLIDKDRKLEERNLTELKFYEIYNRVKLEYFSGRDWLKEEVDNFLESNNKGYFLIEANAGLGKTTFIAHLVQERKYIHLFCEQFSRKTGLPEAIKYIAKQLRSKFRLTNVFNESFSDPNYVFGGLLEKAAEKAKEKGEKLVIAIDALDESASYTETGNVLGLPNYEAVPENAYFILTARPYKYRLNTIKEPSSICADSKYNIDDIERYLSARYDDEQLKNILRRENITKEQFIKALSKKSQGLWIYLHYVLEEIRERKRTPLDLDDLPNGINEYYVKYWMDWENKSETWDNDIKLLVLLAALKEPVTVKILSEFTGIKKQHIRKNLRAWRPFIDVFKKDGFKCYRLYHKTLTDFISNQNTEEKTFNEAERDFKEDIVEEFNKINKKICEYYLEDNFDNFINELFNNKDNLNFIYEYGRKYLIYHLQLCFPILKINKIIDWLQNSIFNNYNDKYNRWYQIKDKYFELDEYAIDINILKDSLLLFIAKDIAKHKQLIQLYIGLILISSTLKSLNSQYPPRLLLQILKLNYWPFNQVLHFAKNLNDVQLLCDMLDFTKDNRDRANKLIKEAIDIANNISDEFDKFKAYGFIIEKLLELADRDEAKRLIKEAIDIANNIEWEEDKVKAYIAIVEKLIELKDVDRAIDIANNISGKYNQVKVYISIVEKLDKSFDTNLRLKYFLDILNSIDDIHRKYLLEFLGKSSSLICETCGIKGLVATSKMIEQVTTWWP